MLTAHISLEYYTIGHEAVIKSQSPVLLGLIWGLIATWWFGLIFGIPLAIFSRIGKTPKRDAKSLIKPIAILLVITFLCAILSGIAGYFLAKYGVATLHDPLASRFPEDRHVPFITALWMHSASYLVSAIGAIALICGIRISRNRAGLKNLSE